VHHDQRVGPLDLAERGANRVAQVAAVRLLHEVGDRLGVGLRREPVTARLEPVTQLTEVLDDAVVDDGDVAGAVLVRVSVEVVRPAVRGPTRMGQPDRRMGRPPVERGLEVCQLAGLLLDEEVALLVDERDPGRVVAPVLEAFQAFDEDRPGLAGPGVADDAAHAVRFSLRGPAGEPCRSEATRGRGGSV
jgi:hypothetical protein